MPNLTARVCLILLLSACAAPSETHAQSLGATYVEANPAGCKVWAPSALSRTDFVPRYTGACKNGRAEGQGKMEWLYRYAELKPKAIWNGVFENGVFIGDQGIPGHVEPLSGDVYLIQLGAIAGGQMTLVASSPQDGPMVLCPARTLAVALTTTPSTDDDAVKQTLQVAADRYRKLCAGRLGNPQLQAFTTPLEADSKGHLPEPIVRARMEWPGAEISAFTNSASDAERARLRQAAAADRLAQQRQAFDDFTRRNGITAWVTTEQLDANPFRFEGKVVGLVVVLDRMLTRSSALVGSGVQEGSGVVYLTGVTPEFPDRSTPVLVAARAGKRSTVEGGGDALYTALAVLATQKCTRNQCDDFLGWQRAQARIVWGDAYTPAP